jgi:hypothetical protein
MKLGQNYESKFTSTVHKVDSFRFVMTLDVGGLSDYGQEDDRLLFTLISSNWKDCLSRSPMY